MTMNQQIALSVIVNRAKEATKLAKKGRAATPNDLVAIRSNLEAALDGFAKAFD